MLSEPEREMEVMSEGQSSAERFDVLISGANFTGFALALALAKPFGDDLRIGVIGAERGRPPFTEPADQRIRDNPRAFAVAAASKSLLEVIGVWSDVSDHAQPVLQIELTDSRLEAGMRPVLMTYDNLTEDGRPASYILPDPVLSTALRRRAEAEPSIAFLGPAWAHSMTSDHDEARVRLEDGRELSARLVVAAEGRQSALRDRAGISLVSRDYDQTGIVAQVRHERGHNSVAVQHFLAGGPFAILPMRANRSCITWSEKRAEAERILSLDDEGFLGELELRFGGRLGRLELVSARRSWPLSMHLARAFTAKRLALIGDTARGVHPIAGQGLNLGFRDVGALCEVIADQARLGLDIGGAQALERYSSWRRFDSVQSAAAFDVFNRVFSNDFVLLRSLREAGLGLADRLPMVKQAFVAEAAGLKGDVPKLLRGEPV